MTILKRGEIMTEDQLKRLNKLFRDNNTQH